MHVPRTPALFARWDLSSCASSLERNISQRWSASFIWTHIGKNNSVASLENALPSAGLQGEGPLQRLRHLWLSLRLSSQPKLLLLLTWPKQGFGVDRNLLQTVAFLATKSIGFLRKLSPGPGPALSSAWSVSLMDWYFGTTRFTRLREPRVIWKKLTLTRWKSKTL